MTEPLKNRGFLAEMFGFLKAEKKWWLLPLIVLIAILALLAVLGETPLAPFIYPFI